MSLPLTKQRSAYGTYLYIAEPGKLETFLRDYRQILIDNFQKVIIEGGGVYWSCNQYHDPRNWNWKPWQHLERLCRKRGLDDYAVRDILVEHLGRKMECECQVLFDERELRKEALKRQFGVNFDSGEVSGWWIETELQIRFQLKCEMEFGILTADDGLPKFRV